VESNGLFSPFFYQIPGSNSKSPDLFRDFIGNEGFDYSLGAVDRRVAPDQCGVALLPGRILGVDGFKTVRK